MRLQRLPADQWDDTVHQSLSIMMPERHHPDEVSNALATFAHHPALTKAFLRFNVHLLFSSTLPPRIRELAILRVAHRRNCAYEWAHHVELAKQAGLTDDEIEAVPCFAGKGAGQFDDFERAVLTGVDELDEKSELSDQTWATLGERFDDRQRMDYIFTVGCYTMLAMAFNTFGIELDNY